jgi:DNA mismatch endonuclease, patch repair protein
MTMSREPRSQEVISYTMSRIRSKDTTIEVHLRRALWKRGLRYRKHYKIAGCPDIVFVSAKVAIFCDSTFWHGRDWEQRKGRLKSNREYWIEKIEGNMKRDVRVRQELRDKDWLVISFWDIEIENNLDDCVNRIINVLSMRQSKV